MSWLVPPSNGSPLILPTKSTVSLSPCSAALALGAVGEGAAGVGHALHEALDLLLGDVGDRALQRNVVESAEFELRQHLQLDLEGEIALCFKRGLYLVLFFGQFDLRLHGEPQVAAVDDLLVGLLDLLLHEVGHHRAAIDALQVRHRHLAGAEAVDPHLLLEVGELAVEPGGEVARGDHHVIGPLEPFAQRFRHLHFPSHRSQDLARGR